MTAWEDIYNGLEEQYQAGDEVLIVITKAIAPAVQRFDDALAGLAAQFEPASMPTAWLDWSITRRGWFLVPGSSEYVKRQVLTKLLGWQTTLGKSGVFEDIIATYTKGNANATGVACALEPRLPIRGGWRVGKSRIGKFRIRREHSNASVLCTITSSGSVPWDAARDALVRGILNRATPSWMSITIIAP
jgi:hypothetical protein